MKTLTVEIDEMAATPERLAHVCNWHARSTLGHYYPCPFELCRCPLDMKPNCDLFMQRHWDKVLGMAIKKENADAERK